MRTLVAARGLSGLAQAVVLLLLARMIEVQTFGVLTAWAGVFLVVAGVFDLGLSGFLLVHRAKGDEGAVRTAIAINRLSALAAATILLGVVVATQSGSLLLTLAMLALSAGLEKNTDTLLSVALADDRVRLAGTSLLLRRVGSLALFALLVWTGVTPLIAYGCAVLITSIAAQIQVNIYIHKAVATDEPVERWRDVLKQSSRYMAQFVSGQARTLDTSVVALIAGGTAAGYYGAATRLAAPVLLVPGAINSVLTPASARANRVAARGSARRVIIVTAVAAALAGMVAPFAPIVITALLGPAYAPSAVAFALNLPAMVFIGFTSPLAGVLQAQGHAKFVAVVSVASVALLLLSVALGATLAGATGAGLGLLTASLVAWLVVAARAGTLSAS